MLASLKFSRNLICQINSRTLINIRHILRSKIFLPNSSKFIGTLNTIKFSGLVIGATTGILTSSIMQSVSADNLTDVELIKEADDLYNKMDYDGIYNLLIGSKDKKNDELLWRLGRATYEKAKAATSEESKKSLFKEALDYVKAALAINDQNFAVHKWMSILIGYVYTYEGTKARISQSYIIKEHMLKACELNPTDGTSRHLLGLWFYNIAEIPWYQRKVASVVFATPPSASYEDALKEFLHAEQIEPNFYSMNYLYIGKCYMKLGNKAEAKVYLEKAANYPLMTKDDEEASSEAKTLLGLL